MNITRMRLQGAMWAILILLVAAPATFAQAEKPYDGIDRTTLYVPARDGTKLALNIYRPTKDDVVAVEKLPVVFVSTPYRARYYDEDGQIQDMVFSPRFGLKSLVEHGYVVAVADVRGKGASYGARRGFLDRTEGLDSYDLIEWLGGQSWSTGNVGMFGCSYLGGATMLAATTTPPSLKAIFTGATDFDKYAFVRRGGITAQFNTRPDEPLSMDLMSVPVDADTDGSMLKEAVAEHAGNTPMAKLWYGMPYRDSMSKYTNTRFWEEVGPYTYVDRLKKSGIAMYFWSNLEDEPTAQMILAAANLESKLIIGPGSHCVPPKTYDFAGEVRRYFDYTLKGAKNGIMEEPKYTYWVNGAEPGNEWVRTDALLGTESASRSYYISGTALQQAPGTAGSTSFAVDYDVSDGSYFSFWVKPMDDHGPGFTSAPLKADMYIEGYPIVDLTVSVDRTDTNVFAYLETVSGGGEVSAISFGRLALSHRKISEAPYETLGLPWHSGRAADVSPVTPGEPVQARFDMTPVSAIIPAGHRLRLVVTGADPRQRNLEDLRENPAPNITVLYGGETASKVEIPVK